MSIKEKSFSKEKLQGKEEKRKKLYHAVYLDD